MKLVERVKNEFENLRYVSNSSNIVKFYGYVIDTDDVSRLYMELMDCNLRQFYHWIHAIGLFPENLLVYIIISLVDALFYCKSKKILHRDIKPTNILLNRSCEIKLCDFGSSIDLDKVEKADLSPSGTIAYWAPELFDSDYIKQDYIKIDESKEIFKTDVWSLGITLWETQSGRLPYLKEGETVSQSDIPRFGNYILSIDGEKLDTDDFLPNYSKKVKEFILSCLLKLEDRYNIEKLNDLSVYFAKNKLNVARKEFAEYMQKIEVNLDEIQNIDEATIDEGIDTISVSENSYETNINELDAQNKKNIQLEIEYLQKIATIEEQRQLIAQEEILLKEKKQKFIDEKLEFSKQKRRFEANANLEKEINQYLPFKINITTKEGLLYFVSNDECVEFNSDIGLRIIYACRMSICKIYPISSETKGIALIISNFKFPLPHGNREGTEQDEKRLQKLFTKLEYNVILEKDLSAAKMRDAVKFYAECPEQTKYSSFIVAILTHGGHDQLIGTDGEKTDSISIHEIFKCVKTDLLVGKPKIFIIQACRGESLDRGIMENRSLKSLNQQIGQMDITESSSDCASPLGPGFDPDDPVPTSIPAGPPIES
uniref:mitogen-activated protein kinase kinase n=1 Tax=Acrobeloides nanus TaxID=290746 RepID=A0A914D1F2_9BILA